MLIDTDTVIPLRWWHLSFDEQIHVAMTMPDGYEPWEWEYGLFIRAEDGEPLFCEDCQEH